MRIWTCIWSCELFSTQPIDRSIERRSTAIVQLFFVWITLNTKNPSISPIFLYLHKQFQRFSIHIYFSIIHHEMFFFLYRLVKFSHSTSQLHGHSDNVRLVLQNYCTVVEKNRDLSHAYFISDSTPLREIYALKSF